MTGRGVRLMLIIPVLALTACTGPVRPAAAPGTPDPAVASGTAFATPNEVPKTTATAGPTSAVQTSSGDANTPVAHYLNVAHTVFPTQDTATIIATAHAICDTLRDDPSIHDAVGNLGARTQSQASADELVRAAIAAYCPNTAAR
jgi:hypothetical protein